MSDVTMEPTSEMHSGLATTSYVEDERPPLCPVCHKRLVILATHSVHDNGGYVRQQLWGCPKGHATAVRKAGSFSPVELLGELYS
ncbi:MAG TPA: hypothetical protein PK691_02170 [Thermomicrobiales bacterium]|nr:hypothetical protein [Thermomicrobiales bacterium]HRA47528.1 hypothetical protein [Thermomicrobiales bacterium]